MKIYRLERNGIGPFIGRSGLYLYSTGKKAKKAQHVHNQHRQTRWATEWFNVHKEATRTGQYMFGTKSKLLLKAYFGFNLQPYFKLGYRIRTYEVPDSEVREMGVELAFPVKYHKLKTVKNVKKAAPHGF